MAIASLILTPDPAMTDRLRKELDTMQGFSLEQETTNGEFILLAEAPDLSQLIGICRDLEKHPGVMSLATSYITEDDESASPES